MGPVARGSRGARPAAPGAGGDPGYQGAVRGGIELARSVLGREALDGPCGSRGRGAGRRSRRQVCGCSSWPRGTSVRPDASVVGPIFGIMIAAVFRRRSPCGGGGRDVTGRKENASEAAGTASRLRRRAGRRIVQGPLARGRFRGLIRRKADRRKLIPPKRQSQATCPAKRRDAVPVASDRFSLRPVTSLPPPPQDCPAPIGSALKQVADFGRTPSLTVKRTRAMPWPTRRDCSCNAWAPAPAGAAFL